MTKDNFECMLCDRKKSLKKKGDHLGVCQDCVRIIKVDWPEGKDVVVASEGAEPAKPKKKK